MPKDWEKIAGGLQKEVDRLRRQNRELKARLEEFKEQKMMKYEIKAREKNQVSVFTDDECLFTGALQVAQEFIFFNSYVRDRKGEEYEQANQQASRAWEEQENSFRSQVQVGSVIEI